MKLKLEAIWNMQQSLARIAGLELMPKESYRIAKALKKLSKEAQDINEQRLKIVDKFAKETYNKEGEKQGKQVPAEKLEEFSKEWDAFLQDEVEIEGLAKVKLPDGVKVTPKEVMDLEDILEIEE